MTTKAKGTKEIIAVAIVAAVGATVTRGAQHRHTTRGDLGKLCVDAEDITLGVDPQRLAFGPTDTVITLWT